MVDSTNVLGIALIGGVGLAAYYNWDKIFSEKTADPVDPVDPVDPEPEAPTSWSDCPFGETPVKQSDGTWKCVKRVSPLDLAEAKSLKDMWGKTIKIEHPLYDANTKYGKKFKNYSISCKVEIDYPEYAEGSPAPNVIISFEPVAPSWSKSAERKLPTEEKVLFGPPKIIFKPNISPTTQWTQVSKPTWLELYNSVGGQREGWSFGPSVRVDTIIDNYPNGQVALIKMRGDGIRTGDARLDIKTGGINSKYWSMGLFTKCNSGSYKWVQGNSVPINGRFDETTGRWATTLSIPPSGRTVLNNDCPPKEHMVTPPQEIGIYEGGSSSLGRPTFAPYVLAPNQNTSPQNLILDTIENAGLYYKFYSKNKPNFYKDSQGRPKLTYGDIDITIPFTYVKKTYSCNCPSDSTNAGQTVTMDKPCSTYNSFGAGKPIHGMANSQPLYDACGGKPAPPSGPVVGGGLVSGGQFGAESLKSSQSFMSEFL